MNNVLILGELNSGKCTLQKQLTSTFGNRSSLNFFKINNLNFNLLRVPCFVDYIENFDNGMALADIIIVLINEDMKDIENIINQVLYCLSFGHKNFIFLVNKIDLKEDVISFFNEMKSSFFNTLQSKKIKIFEDNMKFLDKNWSFISG
jgi:translation elongation factor EF-Tu-like GTPase